MESYLLGAIALGGLYTIANHENEQKNKKTEKFVAINARQNQHVGYSVKDTPQTISMNKSDSNSRASYVSLTGEKINTTEFNHNNMTPYFGGKITGRNFDESQTESILDNMVGSGTHSKSKDSQEPLFKPQENMDWTFGAPNNNDFYKKRMESNVSQKRHNEKPWVSENIGPGLNKEYTTDGSHGFNSGMMSREAWVPKNVDELRTINNPKQTFSLDEHMGPPSSIVQNRAEHAQVKKYNPDTYFSHGPQRYFTSNTVKNATLQTKPDLSDQNRDTTCVEYIGMPSNGAYSTATISNQNFEPPIKDHVYGEIRGIPNPTHPQHITNQKISFSNNETYRSKNTNNTFYGNIQGITNMMSSIAPILDTLKPTRKELVVENLYKDGYISKIGSGGQHIYDPNDIPKSTLRQSINYSVADNNIQVGVSGTSKDIQEIAPSDVLMTETHRSNTTRHIPGTPGATHYGVKDNSGVRNQRNNNNKTTTPWTPGGNNNIFNHNINMKRPRKNENDFTHSRQNVPDHIRDVMPNKQQIGTMRMPNETLTDVNNRIDPSLLDAFKENPYTFSLTSVA